MLSFSHGVLALSADSTVSKASLKFWLLTSLSTFHHQNRKLLDVAVFVFIPVKTAEELGANRIGKILKEAQAKNDKWISDIQILAADNAITQDMLNMFVEQFSEEVIRELADGELGEVYFGYPNGPEVEEMPVCAIRKLGEDSDIEIMKEQSGINYQIGDWYIIGEVDNSIVISEPFSSAELAMEEAKSRFGASRFEDASQLHNHG